MKVARLLASLDRPRRPVKKARGGEDPSHSDEYREYLASDRWKATRAWALAAAGDACEDCGATEGLHVHHVHYRSLGCERPGDVKVLCPPCHERADHHRAAESQRRSAEALYRARLDGWASKVYGEDWELFADADAIEDEFAAWVEDRE
jgi:hypothetical protein